MQSAYLALCVVAALVAHACGQGCTSTQCLNKGVCVIIGGSPSCACATGYYGLKCELGGGNSTNSTSKNPCDAKPCLNNGQCAPSGDRFKCTCPVGFMGTFCQLAVTTATPGAANATGRPSSCPPARSNINNIACNPAEIVFLVETAKGDSYFDVDHEGDFIKRCIDMWNVRDNDIRIGVVFYHDVVEEVAHIDDYKNDPDSLKAHITARFRTRRPSGENDLAHALDYAATTSFAGARPSAEKIVIPIVHMMPENSEYGIVDSAQRLKDQCVTIIALDVRGSRTQNAAVDSHDLVESGIMKQVVSQPWNNHLKNYRDFNQLESSAGQLDDNHCN